MSKLLDERKTAILDTKYSQKMKQGTSMLSKIGQAQTANFLIFMKNPKMVNGSSGVKMNSQNTSESYRDQYPS